MQGSRSISKLLFSIFVLFPNVASSLICGDFDCLGDGSYCCIKDNGVVGCCYYTYLYETWWFWGIWIFVFCMILGCSLACWRRRMQRVRYMVMSQSEYPSYGTVIHTNSNQTMGAFPPPAYPPAYPPGSAAAGIPPQPPGYVNKPPPYSG